MTELANSDVQAGASRHVVRGSIWFIASLGLGALGGFLFWWLAARLEAPATVGEASALFTAILFISYLTSMGLPIAVAKYGAVTRTPPDRGSTPIPRQEPSLPAVTGW